MLRRRLERKGIEVIVASDGEQGIAAAERERPDLILMDLSLPVIDGWEAARRLKSAPETRAIPIIALSAHAMAGDRERALAAGCDDYDTKPVDLERPDGQDRGSPAAGGAAVSDAGADPGRRRQRGQSLHADATAEARGLRATSRVATNGREALDLLASAAVRPGPARHHDAGDERLRGARAAEGRRRAAARPGDHDLGGLDELDSVVRCIELGAEDYLPKPFNPVLLKARIGASLERKRLRDREAAYTAPRSRQEAARGPSLLHAILPAQAVRELKATDAFAPRRFEDVAVLFGDLVGFTPYCEGHPAEEVVAEPRPAGRSTSRRSPSSTAWRRSRPSATRSWRPPISSSRVDRPGAWRACAARSTWSRRRRRNPAGWQIRVGIHRGRWWPASSGSQRFSSTSGAIRSTPRPASPRSASRAP